ncbi:TRAP transporter small permease [Chelativorans salis]|uniref:TRAP transporter small permease protein n=1 Tax=Chelativorans salis TaxID=2978478 RepID=A0ABT2LRI1_9HYPH|nr:TRAP transporter small permease [Chelativorans sp. EGI FJ00035]MCT7377150.1 TRAP transporter small permease [Chelativorans sp. EGI FJ00035]
MSIARKVLAAFCVLVLVALVAVPFIQVVMRDVVGAAIVGAEEFTRFLLIVLVFTAFPVVVMEHENIVMAEFREVLPRRLRKVLAFVITLSAAAAAGFIAYVSWGTIFNNLNNATPTLKIPFWLFLGSTFLGFALACLIHLADLRHPPREETKVL